MVALGLVLLVVSGALALGVVLSNTDPVTASAFGVTLTDVTVGGFFLVGAVTGLVFMLGLAMMLAGAARRRSRTLARKHTVRDVRTEKEQLEQENADLRAKLNDEPYPADAADTTSRDSVDLADDRVVVDDQGGSHAKRGVFHRG